MTVLIPHPTEELIFAKLQKELIAELFEDGRIMYAVKPLWIRWLSDAKHRIETTVSHNACGFDTIGALAPYYSNHRSSIELGDLQASDTEILIPITITADISTINTKLTLIKIHSGKDFTDSDRQIISKIKQPVRQLKVFRLGVEKELSSNSKCITESKWYKIK